MCAFFFYLLLFSPAIVSWLTERALSSLLLFFSVQFCLAAPSLFLFFVPIIVVLDRNSIGYEIIYYNLEMLIFVKIINKLYGEHVRRVRV